MEFSVPQMSQLESMLGLVNTSMRRVCALLFESYPRLHPVTTGIKNFKPLWMQTHPSSESVPGR